MAKKNKSKKNKNKNLDEASSSNLIPNSPPPPLLLLLLPPHPPPVRPKRTIADQRLYNKMEKEALAIATTAFTKYDCDSSIAEEIKTEFDSRYGPTWHCIVGSSFVSNVSYEPHFYFFLYIAPKDILLFKCG
ncbi:unnamed protein product [Vicia faba]|uniref:Dynein light chain n=1 Tax=Vicia faba TaxID=3906 RepID=A0AAV0Z6T3_VICFA|nr:unnamed protein product [Vicia faba]